MRSLLKSVFPALGLTLALGAGPAWSVTLGLNGWLPLGDVSLQATDLLLTTAYVDGVDDEAGNLSGLSAVPAATLEAFAGLAPLALDLSASDYATEGSIALRSLTVQAGDTLRLHWSFSSQDASFADHAFVVIGSDVLSLANALQAPAGPRTLVYTFATGGSVLLAAGVVDSVDTLGVSTLRISGFEVSPVPEPASLSLALAGLGLMAGLLRLGARPHKPN